MKKVITYLFVFIVLFSIAIPSIKAEYLYGKVNSSIGLLVRENAGTSYAELSTGLSNGAIVKILDSVLTIDGTTGCQSGKWYKINYLNVASGIGYVCSSYMDTITVQTDDEFEVTLSSFPEGYRDKLRLLHLAHPTWNFVAINTNLDWSTAVSMESACGNSYIASSNINDIDSSCTNKYTSTWYPASNTAVARYMDPRNFLTENYIFQFDYYKYDTKLSGSYINASNSILKDANFYKYYINKGVDFSSSLNTAGSATNVSPTFLASRMLQELGTDDKLYNLFSGTYTLDENDNPIVAPKEATVYYNFFNYGVNDTCATTYGTTYCGIKSAKNYGWNSLYNALYGGATKMAQYYISKGQYTGYLQKFNVIPTANSSLYLNQYMTNIAAPSSESKTAYNTYKNLNLLSSGFTFYIPVYKNMTGEIYNSDNGAVDEGEQDQVIIPISTIITSSGYKYENGYIKGIGSLVNVITIKNNIQAVGGTVTITDKEGKIVSTGNIGTGYKVNISNSNSTESLEVVVKGDTSGDGAINALDLLQVQKSILGTYTLSGSAKMAGDTSGDGIVNALDLLQVQKNILGTYTI